MARTAASTSSTREALAAPPGGVPLGRIVGAHGLRGELRVRAGDDDRTILMGVPRVRLARDEGERGAEEGREYEVEGARPGRAGECRLTLRGIESRDDAEALRGTIVCARADDLEALPEGEFYAYELVGCTAFDASGRRLGVVTSIGDPGAGGADLLVVEDDAGGEHLIPAAAPLLRKVDPKARRIEVDVAPGLLDTTGA